MTEYNKIRAIIKEELKRTNILLEAPVGPHDNTTPGKPGLMKKDTHVDSGVFRNSDDNDTDPDEIEAKEDSTQAQINQAIKKGMHSVYAIIQSAFLQAGSRDEGMKGEVTDLVQKIANHYTNKDIQTVVRVSMQEVLKVVSRMTQEEFKKLESNNPLDL